MRRTPNPWIAVPVVVATVLGWLIGGAVARVGCTDGCVTSELLFSFVGAAVGFAGTLVVAVLAMRSLAEWHALNRDDQPND